MKDSAGDPAPEPDPTRRRFLLKGLSHFGVLSLGASYAGAIQTGFGKRPHEGGGPACGSIHAGGLYPDSDCGTPGSAGLHSDGACNVAVLPGSAEVYFDSRCGASTPNLNLYSDSSCGGFIGSGSYWQDEDCVAGGSGDSDCGLFGNYGFDWSDGQTNTP